MVDCVQANDPSRQMTRHVTLCCSSGTVNKRRHIYINTVHCIVIRVLLRGLELGASDSWRVANSVCNVKQIYTSTWQACGCGTFVACEYLNAFNTDSTEALLRKERAAHGGKQVFVWAQIKKRKEKENKQAKSLNINTKGANKMEWWNK